MKRKLRIEDLSVTSFSTEDAGAIIEGRGTVKGMAINPPPTQQNISCIQQFTCGATECCSIFRTCDSCLGTCNFSCGGTCADTCIQALCG